MTQFIKCSLNPYADTTKIRRALQKKGKEFSQSCGEILTASTLEEEISLSIG